MKLKIKLELTDDSGFVMASKQGYVDNFQTESTISVIRMIHGWVSEEIASMKASLITFVAESRL